MKTINHRLIVYVVMIAFIFGSVIIVGALGRMLTFSNTVWIVATGLALAYVVDERLRKLATQS
jgi:hypothetical protein